MLKPISTRTSVIARPNSANSNRWNLMRENSRKSVVIPRDFSGQVKDGVLMLAQQIWPHSQFVIGEMPTGFVLVDMAGAREQEK